MQLKIQNNNIIHIAYNKPYRLCFSIIPTKDKKNTFTFLRSWEGLPFREDGMDFTTEEIMNLLKNTMQILSVSDGYKWNFKKMLDAIMLNEGYTNGSLELFYNSGGKSSCLSYDLTLYSRNSRDWIYMSRNKIDAYYCDEDKIFLTSLITKHN